MSAAADNKRFDATPARKSKAKREGNVARSAEVSAIAAFAFATIATFAVLPLLGRTATAAIVAAGAHPTLGRPPLEALAVVSFAGVPAVAAAAGSIVAGFLQAGGVRFNLPKLQLKRLDPIAGMKRMLGMETAVGILRAVLASTVVGLALWPVALEVLARSTKVAGASDAGPLGIAGAQRVCWVCIAVGAVFALADFGLVRRRWLTSLKMSFEEIRRDQKENDGDPHARSRRKALHLTLVRGSVTRTKDASFVLVNPTHIAIAIRYAPPDVAVPEILVRAADDAAHAVRALARERGIPIVENVALARELYACGQAGRAIPATTFVAVARVIVALIREGVLT